MTVGNIILAFKDFVERQKEELVSTRNEIQRLKDVRQEIASQHDGVLEGFEGRLTRMESRMDAWETDIKEMFERIEETRASAERSWQTLDSTVKSINAGVNTEPARDQQLDELLDILKRDRA